MADVSPNREILIAEEGESFCTCGGNENVNLIALASPYRNKPGWPIRFAGIRRPGLRSSPGFFFDFVCQVIAKYGYLGAMLSLVAVETINDKIVEVIFCPVPGQQTVLTAYPGRKSGQQGHGLGAGVIILAHYLFNTSLATPVDLIVVELFVSVKKSVQGRRRTILVGEGIQSINQEMLEGG
jgi:hypothetical protein